MSATQARRQWEWGGLGITPASHASSGGIRDREKPNYEGDKKGVRVQIAINNKKIRRRERVRGNRPGRKMAE